jgi:hypothetical protein
MMAGQGLILAFICLVTIVADELREIYVHWAAIAAPGTGQAGPELALTGQILLLDQGVFYDLSRGEGCHGVADRTASGADSTFHAVIDLCLGKLHNPGSCRWL